MQFQTIAAVLAAFAATNVLATPLPAPVPEAAAAEAVTKRGGAEGYYAVYPKNTVPAAVTVHGDQGRTVSQDKSVLSLLGIPLLTTDESHYSEYENSDYDVVYIIN